MKSFLTRKSSSLTYLNVTQFLGALNDNLFKLLVVFYLIHKEGQEHSNTILAVSGAVFVAPFLLFLAGTGTLADRFSKRNIIIISKMLEVVVMATGMLALWVGWTWGAYAILFLMATQSALFGPSKYGIVPEIVDSEKIASANGLLTSFTYFAVIVGTFLASFLSDISDRNFVLVSSICTVIAIIGTLPSFWIEYTPPSGSKKKVSAFFLRDVYKALRIAYGENSLLLAVMGSGYFLFAGAFVQLNIIPFSIQSLGLNEIQGGYLFLLTALGIGIGSIIAGKISGSYIELGLVPFGGFGMAFGCFMLEYCQDELSSVIWLVVTTGIAAGMYVVPLDAFIQYASPDQRRGQIVAAASFIAFIGVLFASGALYLFNDVMGLAPSESFRVVGVITLVVVGYITFHLRDYLIRFIAMIASRFMYEMHVEGEEHVPPGTPSLIICTYHSWSDSIMVLGAQRQRIHFFIECKKGASLWLRLLRRFFKITPLPALDPKNLNIKVLKKLRSSLEKGRTACIFLDQATDPEVESLVFLYQKLLEGTEFHVVSVDLQKNPKKYPDHGLIYRFLRKVRVPASLTFHQGAP